MKFINTDRPTSELLGGLLIVCLVLLGLLGWLWQSYFTARSPLTSALPTSTYPASAPASPLVLAGTALPSLGAPISADNASQVVQLARWGEGTIYDATWSPAGTLLAAATSLGVSLYDAQTLQPVKFLETGVAINQVVFSPDGSLLAGAGSDFAVWVWQVQAGTLRYKLTWHTAQVSSLAFSTDGSLLASGSADQTVRLWRVVWEILNLGAEGRNLRSFDLSEANLSQANLTGADLRAARLDRAYLFGANLTGADLSQADLTEAHVTEAQLATVLSLSGAILPDGKIHK